MKAQGDPCLARCRAARQLWVAVCVLLAGCGTGDVSTGGSPSASGAASPSVSAPADGASSPSAAASAAAATPPAPSPLPPSSVCGDPTAHVYHPYRLELKNRCMTVSGTLAAIRSEADGDYHVLLQLDPAYAGMVNGKNDQYEHGDLVLEPVCEHMITQSDATYACVGYRNPLVVPPIGLHVVATGAYVLDTLHGWTELHPLWAIRAG